jgi:multimeric flavodoxin WrbA
MKIVAVNGSPRRDKGRCYALLSRVLLGAREAGAETAILHLIDEHPAYCVHCNHPCFETHECAEEPATARRSKLLDDCDGIAIAAPVYVWQPSGLTAAFFDKLRLAAGAWIRPTSNGRPALGIAVAGVSGTGVFSSLQLLYASLCHWKFQPLQPLPVTRFNFEKSLELAQKLGQQLAQTPAQPFEEMGDMLLAYDEIPFLRFNRMDEFRWLAQQIREGLKVETQFEATAEVNRLLAEAERCRHNGDMRGESRAVFKAYDVGYQAWK